MMKFPLIEVDSTEYCEEFYMEYFQILRVQAYIRKGRNSNVVINPAVLSTR